MRKFFILFLVIALCGNAGAQQGLHKIVGTVTDSIAGKGIQFVTVALSQPGVGTTTGNTGKFELEKLSPGNYNLSFSFVGYRIKTIAVIIATSEKVLNVGIIQLAKEDNKLADVTVVSQKALVEDKGDRLVYNAERDISNAGGTAADVLRKVPTLTVDLNGNVQMRGNGNIKVLVNGKPSAMMARNLADALRQMPANLIKSIEVITSPGAKYDAEGSAGVINIITKKGLKGFNGSVNATAGNFNRSLGTRFSLNQKKIGLSLSATGYQNRNISENTSVRTALLNGMPLNILTQHSNSDNTGTGGYGELSFDYDPDSTSRINLAANVWGGNYPSNSTVVNKLTDPSNSVLQAFRNESKFTNPYGNGQIDLGYTKTFKKTDQEFSFLTQFSRMPDNYFYDINNYSTTDQIIFRQHSTNYSRNKELTIQSDYTHPFIFKGKKDTTNLKIEIGIKAIIRDIGSEFRVDQSNNGTDPMLPDPSQSNDFDYMQRVYSGYTSLRLDTKTKWSLNAGARFEHTVIHGDFLTTQTKLDNQYTNLIPSINLSKKVKTNTFKVSYTQRIQRPLIWYLNPWLNASDPKNVTTGNPFLKPELNHGLELSHNLSTEKGLSVNSSLYWRHNNNAIEYLSTVDAAGISLNMPYNIGKRETYGINVNISGKPNKKWDLNGGTDVRYAIISAASLGQRNEGVVWNINLNSTYKLPKDYTLQANGSFSSGWLNLQGQNSGFYWYGMSGKKEFWKKKASLTLGINNPFNRGVVQRGDRFAPTFTSESRGLYVTRSARLTFEWRFGQMSTGSSKQSKKISNDDTGR